MISLGLGISITKGTPRQAFAIADVPGLLAEYRFNEGSGGTLLGYDANGHNAALDATLGLGSDYIPAWTAKGLTFSNHIVQIPASIWASVRAVAIWCDFAKSPTSGTDLPTLISANTVVGDIHIWGGGVPVVGDLGQGTGTGPNACPVGPNGMIWNYGSTPEVYFNGTVAPGYLNPTYSVPAFSAASAVWLGFQVGIGRPFVGKVYYLALFSQAISASDAARMNTYVSGVLASRSVTVGDTQAGSLPQIVFDGDSLTVGAGASNASNYPAVTIAGRSTPVAWSNVALGAELSSSLLTRGPLKVDTLWPLRSGTPKTYVLWAGTNDIGSGGSGWRTPAATYADLKSRAQAALAAGATRVVICNIIARGDSLNPSWAANRTALNGLIAGMPGEVSGVVLADLAARAELSDPTDTTYYATSNGVHLNAVGYAVVAAVVGPLLGVA